MTGTAVCRWSRTSIEDAREYIDDVESLAGERDC